MYTERGTLANSEDPDEMPQNAAFHHLLRQIQSYGTKVHIYLKSYISDPLKYLNGNPISNQISVWEYPPEI